MKFVLCALYLQFNSAAPELRTKLYDTKAHCQEAAREYVKRKVQGDARAFCMEVHSASSR